jgi:hypothetical protein
VSFGERASDRRGHVVITRFVCPTRARLVLLMFLHFRIKRQVRKQAGGFVGAAAVVLWQQRTLLSVTLWRHLDDIYEMGKVNHHIEASRMPARLGIQTTCGVYAYGGDWRKLMFGTDHTSADPLVAAAQSLTAEKLGADSERKTS